MMPPHGDFRLAAQEAAKAVGHIVAQRAQEMPEQLVQLKAVAAAPARYNLLIQRFPFKRDRLAGEYVQIFVGHGVKMRPLQRLERLGRGRQARFLQADAA